MRGLRLLALARRGGERAPDERAALRSPPSRRDEGRMALIATGGIHKALGPELTDEVRIQEAGATEWLSGEESDRDIREWILGLLVLVMLAEQMMAYRLSYHPSAAGGGK